MKRSLLALAVIVTVLLLSDAVLGQGRARIEGIVRGAAGEALPGVTVQVARGSALLATAITSVDGSFRVDFDALAPAETYEVRVTLTGFTANTVRLSALQPSGSISAQGLNVTARFSYMLTSAPPPPPPTSAPPPRPPAPSPTPPSTIPSSATPEQNHAIVKVFYASDRARIGPTVVDYGTARNPSGQLALGRFDVSVPRDRRLGTIERPAIWTLWREDPAKHFIIVGRTQQTYERFYGEISERVDSSERKEAFVFIHGYNVTFESAIYRTAQIAYDLTFDGAPILYSWPSEGTEIGYPTDYNNNEWTIPHLRWFLEDVSAKSGASVVHLIAHSMGNRALVNALRDIAVSPRTGPRPRFKQILLTAPDIDLGTFKQLAQTITGTAERITLYASSNDLALKASKTYQGYQRAGDVLPDVVVLPGIDTIDVSALETGLLGHSYVGDNKSVLSDIFALIRNGLPPNQRFGLRASGQPPRQWWVFRP